MSAEYKASGGHKLDGTTRQNLIDTYQVLERGGWLYWIDCHRRSTAVFASSRYQSRDETDSDIWSGHYVAVWTDSPDIKNKIEKEVPDPELLAVIRGVPDGDDDA